MDGTDRYRHPAAVVCRRVTRLGRSGHASSPIVEGFLRASFAAQILGDLGSLDLTVGRCQGDLRRTRRRSQYQGFGRDHRRCGDGCHQADDDQGAPVFPLALDGSRLRPRGRDGVFVAVRACITHGPDRSIVEGPSARTQFGKFFAYARRNPTLPPCASLNFAPLVGEARSDLGQYLHASIHTFLPLHTYLSVCAACICNFGDRRAVGAGKAGAER